MGRIISWKSLSGIDTSLAPLHETAFSYLYQASCNATPVLVEFPKVPVAWDPNDPELLQRGNQRHPNLFLILGACLDSGITPFCIILEFPGTALSKHLPQSKALLFERLLWAQDAAKG